MRIEDILLEYSSSKPIIVYHTTLRTHLKSVLSNGLVPNKSEGGYASGLKSSSGYSLSALPGTYFFRKYNPAKQLANSMNADKGEDALIVICQVQPKTASLDEDNLVGEIIKENSLRRKLYKIQKSGDVSAKDFEDLADEIIQNSLSGKINDSAIDNVRPELIIYVKALSDYMQDGSSAAEGWLKNSQNSLTKKLRHLLMRADQMDTHDSFKIDAPITFSGANKIIGLYLPQQGIGWGNLGEFERDAYHKYDSPMRLVK